MPSRTVLTRKFTAVTDHKRPLKAAGEVMSSSNLHRSTVYCKRIRFLQPMAAAAKA